VETIGLTILIGLLIIIIIAMFVGLGMVSGMGVLDCMSDKWKKKIKWVKELEDAKHQDYKWFWKLVIVGWAQVLVIALVLFFIGSPAMIYLKVTKDARDFKKLPYETQQNILNDCHSENNFCATPEPKEKDFDSYWENN